ncbi:MAG: preprotein translocase subunit SecA [candidate division WOR-3 bacterium]
MFKFLIDKIIGSRNEREIRKLWPKVEEINAIYETFHGLKDEDILKKTEDFEKRIRDGENPDNILPEAFALVKEVTRRLCGKKWEVTGHMWEWNMIPFDVQLLGAIVLYQGKIAEMKTGEGKTLVATMPLYLHGIIGRIKGTGVHLVTVNDYLARRDRQWMGPVYESLGLSVGVIQNEMDTAKRKIEYAKDITYGTNNEFGFDYLRDNMVYRAEDRVQRGHYYAIVDEVDSILIDEARTPLIISGPVEYSSAEIYRSMKPLAENLVRKQTQLVTQILFVAENLLKQGKEVEAAEKIIQAKLGMPKAKKLFKLLQEPGVMKLVDKVELELMKEINIGGEKTKRIEELKEELYFWVDEKSHAVEITEKGREEVEKREKSLFALPDLSTELHKIDHDQNLSSREKFYEKERILREYADKSDKIHALKQLLKAYMLFEKDVDYVVMDGKVIIVDEFTGRLMPGRRWSDGLHEAVEAKEGVAIQRETQTLATITIQNYFRMYEKLAGMTGTAATEAQEFWEIYKLDVIQIPTNKPIRRIDYPDVIFKTKKEKYEAIVNEIEKWHKVGRPILVGTTSVEVSELLSRLLKRKGIPHQVLNAKYHEREAEIIARAGQYGAVTIATNMAGRGTDIKLGEKVVKAKECAINNENPTCTEDPKKCMKEVPCGLYIIGTEKHESRRIDNQLRGRAGRQGDPGSSRFFLSLEDDLLRLFGSDRVMELMERFGSKDEGPIESPMVTKALETAQKRVEMQNFQIRKRLLEYDDVMNKQREVIYKLRNDILDDKDLRGMVMDYAKGLAEDLIDKHLQSSVKDESWNLKDLRGELAYYFLYDFSEIEAVQEKEEVKEKVFEKIEELYREREDAFGEEKMREIEKVVLLTSLDHLWREHLYALDHLREGVYLRAYAQKDPLVEYKKESLELFDELMEKIRNESVMRIFRIEVPKMPKKFAERMVAFKPSFEVQKGHQDKASKNRGER